MMRKPILFFIAILFFCACSKDNNNDVLLENSSDYLMLKTGNYWIYEEHFVGENTDLFLSLDSIYVAKDTTIKGNQYYIMNIYVDGMGATSRYRILRDSADYIIGYDRGIVFSANDFTNVFDTFYVNRSPNTVAIYYTSMAAKDSLYTVPAGNFKTYSFRQTWHMQPGWDADGKIGISDTRYAKNVGMVYENLGFVSGVKNYPERRLIRYHVQ